MGGLSGFVGPYHVGSLIIETDNSLIYESFHPQKCEKLAIKAIKKNVCTPQMIEDECDLMQQVSHPNIMHIIDSFDLPEYRCVVMPLATGGDLFEYIEQNGRMGEQMACKVMYSAFDAINHLHQMGIWHRDIKPENFLLMDANYDDPTIYLADFGYAKRFEIGERGTDWLGTPLYAAPEIYKKQPYTESIDLWSLGVTMYIILSGESPFPTDNQIEQYSAIINEKYDFESDAWDEVSNEAKDLIRWLIKANPDERISAEDALKNPWFEKYFPEHTKPALARKTATALNLDAALDEADVFDGFDNEEFDDFNGF